MWMFYAIGSSFFAGITAILAKCGIRKTDSNVATAIRTIVVLLFSWLMVLITGTWTGISEISGKTLLFLVLSGLATGASWLCYFHKLNPFVCRRRKPTAFRRWEEPYESLAINPDVQSMDRLQ